MNFPKRSIFVKPGGDSKLLFEVEKELCVGLGITCITYM
jgi:hypothetical protein